MVFLDFTYHVMTNHNLVWFHYILSSQYKLLI